MAWRGVSHGPRHGGLATTRQIRRERTAVLAIVWSGAVEVRHPGEYSRARRARHPTSNAVSKHEQGGLKLRWRNDPVALSALWWATRFVCLVDGSDGKEPLITMWNEACLDIKGSRHGGSVEGFQGLRSDSR